MNSVLVWVVVVVALGFDFTNGFHDTANAVATSVSTRALSPRTAVFVAAVANLAGAFVTTAVAKTVGQGIIDTGLATEKAVLAALVGAIVSPVLGFAGAFFVLLVIYWAFVRVTPGVANRGFRFGQLASGTWVAFTHGANDAQKTMGVIALALWKADKIDHFYIPAWVIV